MNDRTLYGVLKRLERATMLQLKSNNHATTIYICNWGKWQQERNTSATEAHHLRNTKQEEEGEEEIITTNVVKAKTPRADIDDMFIFWEQATGMAINGQVTKNRYACSNLLKKYGKETLQALVRAVAASQGVQFAPSISDFSSLQSKQNELSLWIKRYHATNQSKVVTV